MPRAVAEVAVAATEWRLRGRGGIRIAGAWCWFLSGLLLSAGLQSAVLPEDSVSTLYHRYEGGGMTIDGPAVLVRKSVGNQVSVSAGYYVDAVSAASVDVVATASEYTEERTEYSAGVDLLNEKTILSVGYVNSSENDYDASTVHFSLSQDFFGDLTTLTLGVAKGSDEIGRRGDSSFREEADRINYRIGVSQVLTRNALMGIDIETISDEGFLNNPYRQVRFLDPNDNTRFLYQPEVYPESRTSTAVAVRGLYYLPYRASLKGEYRFFHDTWGIKAHTFETAYVHPLDSQWTLEGRYRFYTQDAADFYSDLFPFEDAELFLARDKEMSTFSGHTFGAGVTWAVEDNQLPGIDKAEVGLQLDYLDFSYDDFRDVTQTGFAAGTEPLYQFDAFVTRATLTLRY